MAFKKSWMDTIFVLIILIFGIIIFFVAATSIGKLSDRCRSNVIRDGFVIICAIGLILITLALAYFFCTRYGGECYLINTADRKLGELYLGVCSTIAFCLMVLTALMGYELQKNSPCSGSDDQASSSEKSDGRDIKFGIWFIFAISTILFIASGIGVGYSVYYISGFTKDLKKISDEKKEKEKKEKETAWDFL